jgi:hypothetical protein
LTVISTEIRPLDLFPIRQPFDHPILVLLLLHLLGLPFKLLLASLWIALE